jgi:hypothetical protein
MILARIPVLDPAGCRRAAAEVCRLGPHWIPRMPPPAAFFTLGVASYQDLSGPAPPFPRADYYRDAPVYNAILLNRFAWLFELLQRALGRHLGAPVRFGNRLAAPGFHIFEDAAIPRADVASVHCDLQYQLIDWNDGAPAPDFAEPISFTLPIRLPRGGGGLNVWDITCEEIPALMRQHDAATLAELIGHRKRTFHPYSLGVMVVHSGHQVHQIGPSADVRPGDQRITLQGHALRRSSEWLVYW